APNFLTKPPTFPDFQIRNAVTRPLGSVSMSENRDGITYAGVRHEFAIHPQEPGGYAVDGQQVMVTYAAEPPQTREATLALPRLTFEAFIPEAAQALDPFVAAARLVVRQSVEKPPADLKVGDAVIRTVTIEAEGIPAMLLPELQLNAPDRLAVYRDQPTLQDRTESRSDTLTSTRVERATYILKRPGSYVLPAIDVAWWNLSAREVEHGQADAIRLQVAANPALAPVSEEATPNAKPLWRDVLSALAMHWPIVLA